MAEPTKKSTVTKENDMRNRPPVLFRLLPLLVFLTFAGGCATMRAEPPEIALAGIQIENLTLSHAILSADLTLFNPNDFAITAREIRYTLSLNNITVARGNSLQSVRLPAHGSNRMPLRLSTSYLNLLRLGPHIEKQGPLPYEISGEIILGSSLLGSRGFPFEKKGTLDLSELSEPSAPVGDMP
jgi:LEA14-like dessication related protein